MKTLIIYDSLYGNTRAIAEAVNQHIFGDSEVLNVRDVENVAWQDLDLLFVGSPTHGGRPSPLIRDFLAALPTDSLTDVRVAAFDTSVPAAGANYLTRLAISLLGYAARHILDGLEQKGGTIIAEPEHFFVLDKEGPLQEGEIERATRWGKEVSEQVSLD